MRENTRRINGKTTPVLVTWMHLPCLDSGICFRRVRSACQSTVDNAHKIANCLLSGHQFFFQGQLLPRPKPQLPFLKLSLSKQMRELNAQLRPLPIFLEVVAESKSTWNSAVRDVAKCIKKIAGIRWKRWSLALVRREVHAGLNYVRLRWGKEKKIHLLLAVKTQVSVMCRFMHHTLTATQVKTVKTTSAVAQAKGARTTTQADRSKKRGKIWQLFKLACNTCNNVDDFFFAVCAWTTSITGLSTGMIVATTITSSTVDLLLHVARVCCTVIHRCIILVYRWKEQITVNVSLWLQSSCAPRRSMICTDCTTLTSDSKCSSLSRTNE